MLTRIELTNFMSHVATVIEPAPGLTVLVGPNNCGKSAVVAALQLLCKNQEARFAVRHGARECLVQVHTSDGDTIVWRRTKTSASYRLNDQLFDRLGRGVPDSLHKLLRLPLVGDETESDFDIHFGAQKSPIFLLDSPAGVAARFFASSSDAIRLVEMQRRHKEKLSQKQQRKRSLEGESRQLARELEQLAPVVELDARLKDAAKDYNDVQRAAERLVQSRREVFALAVQSQAVTILRAEHEALRPLEAPPALADPAPLATLRSKLAAAVATAERATAQSQAFSELPAPPRLSESAPLARACELLRALQRDIHCTEQTQAALRQLNSPPALAEIESLQRLIAQLAVAGHERQSAEARSQSLRPLAAPPPLADAPQLERTIAALSAAEAQVQCQRQRQQSIALLVSPPPAISDQPLRDLLQSLCAAAKLVTSALEHASRVDKELAAAGEALRDYASAECCPTCGGPLDAQRLISRAAVGRGGHTHD